MNPSLDYDASTCRYQRGTPEHEALLRAHNAVAAMAEHHAECLCFGWMCEEEEKLARLAHFAAEAAHLHLGGGRGNRLISIHRPTVEHMKRKQYGPIVYVPRWDWATNDLIDAWWEACFL